MPGFTELNTQFIISDNPQKPPFPPALNGSWPQLQPGSGYHVRNAIEIVPLHVMQGDRWVNLDYVDVFIMYLYVLVMLIYYPVLSYSIIIIFNYYNIQLF